MNNEIKEILDKLKNENNYQVDCNDGSAFKELFANEIYLLLDYITKLEQQDYKSRCEKAIEYIKSNKWAKDYENSNCRTHLLNILNGE